MLKCVITRLAAEPRPGPLGELKCTPDPLAAMGKPTSKGKGRGRKEGEGRGGREGGKGRKGGREGKGRGRKDFPRFEKKL